MKHAILKSGIGYLCAAPRISTRPNTDNGGPRAHILSFIRACENLGYSVECFIVGDRVPQDWVKSGAKRAVTGGFFRSLAVDVGRLVIASVNIRRAWRELGGQVDWIYERYAAFRTLGWIFKRHGIPWILETNGPLFREVKDERKNMVLTGLARQLELRAYRECDALVCITESLKEIIVSEAGISPEKVVVVPNGVDTERFNPMLHKPKRLFSNFTIGFVGSLYPRQGIDILIEAVHDLRQAGLDLSLVIVGDGMVYEACQTQTHDLAITSNVAFVGRVAWEEVPQYIAGFDLCYSGQTQLLVGKMYHSPLKIYEYMAMAKPVVASEFEDARSVIQEGKTGFLFEPGNKENLKHALVSAYYAREQLTDMGRRAREMMVTHHSWEARISAMLVSIEQILESKFLASSASY